MGTFQCPRALYSRQQLHRAPLIDALDLLANFFAAGGTEATSTWSSSGACECSAVDDAIRSRRV
jgi:hypothetical protein